MTVKQTRHFTWTEDPQAPTWQTTVDQDGFTVTVILHADELTAAPTSGRCGTAGSGGEAPWPRPRMNRPREQEQIMARGRNSKSAVLKDTARDRKQHDRDAAALETAAAVIQHRFTGEGELTGQLGFLAAKIRGGAADHTDHLLRDPLPAGGRAAPGRPAEMAAPGQQAACPGHRATAP